MNHFNKVARIINNMIRYLKNNIMTLSIPGMYLAVDNVVVVAECHSSKIDLITEWLGLSIGGE